MPIYEFRCKKCGRVFEYLVFKSDEPHAPCPSCGADDAERIMSTFSSVSASPSTDIPASSTCGSSGGFS
ncbi:MAG: zinc ribbon domain-containing protein [Deltaproteobacteria bacterium]|nr:MAG: zinc ribbon domain-containing protein [Deltaproteobacteria bacterium]